MRGSVYEEVVEPISPSARVVARFADDSPAIVVSRFGKGKMMTIGSFLGMAYEAERDETLGRFFTGLLDWGGVSRSVEVTGVRPTDTIEVRTLPPYDVVHVLNRYFHEMGLVINRNGGSIDNYMGDGLMALFGMENSAGAALQAVNAGLEMIQAAEHLKPYLEAIYGRSFRIGIGVHYGEVVVGAIGAQSLRRVTAIGDAVNLASRIEAANKQAGTELLISEDTYNAVKDQVRVGKTVCVTLPGKTGEYALYEVTSQIASE